MMRVSEFKTYLEQQFPSVKFYNGAINKSEKHCIGVYAKGNVSPVRAIGAESSYNRLPISILVHWGESTDACEGIANQIYQYLYITSDIAINGRRIISVELPDSGPIDVSRDSNNICEMVIRAIVVYEREVSA